MNRKDELTKSDDRDGDGIPDDADVAEAIKDVADMFKGRGQATEPANHNGKSAIPGSGQQKH